VDVAVRKAAPKVQSWRYKDKISTRYDGKLRAVSLKKETIDPNGIKGFGHNEKNHACQFLLAEVRSHSFNVAGHLKSRAMFGSDSKPLITQ
jgi:hypothetical protein